MGNIITYSYVIPREWDQNYTEQELIRRIWEEIQPYLTEDANWFFGPVITIAGVTAVLNVMSFRFCWWFAIPGDRTPSEDRYHFSRNFINFNYWANHGDILNILDDDGDADTLILDEIGDVNPNYAQDQEAANRLNAIHLRQIQLIRRVQNNLDPEADVGLVLDTLYEEEDHGIPTCEDPSSKIEELNREIFKLKQENSDLKDKVEVINLWKRKLDVSNRNRARLGIDNVYQRQKIANLEKIIQDLKEGKSKSEEIPVGEKINTEDISDDTDEDL